METYDLALLTISQDTQEWPIPFERAKLFVIHNYGTLSWYIDVDGITQASLLQHFATTDEIGVNLAATTIGGRVMKGQGFFHPNPANQAAAIRGQGELEGYMQDNPAR